MKFRIHYTLLGIEKHYDVEGESVEDAIKKNEKEMKARLLIPQFSNMWSEEIKEKGGTNGSID